MTQLQEKSFIAKALYTMAATVIILAGIKQIGDIISLVILSILIAVICYPLLRYLQEKSFPTALNLFVIFTVLLCALIGTLMIIPTAVKAVYAAIVSSADLFTNYLNTIERKLFDWGVVNPDFALKDLLEVGKVVNFSGSVFNTGANLLVDLLLVFTLVLFMLYEAQSFTARADGLFAKHGSIRPATTIFLNQLRHYMIIKFITSALTAAILLPVLWIFLPANPWPWVFMAFVMNFVPIFGSIVAAIVPVLLTLLSGTLFDSAVIVSAYLLVNIIVGNILEPKMMGKGLGLSALIVLLSLSFWGWVLGIIGLFMAAPLTLSVKLFLEMDPELRWIAQLLGEEPEQQS